MGGSENVPKPTYLRSMHKNGQLQINNFEVPSLQHFIKKLELRV